MSNYREIVTKAVVSKGKKSFTTTKKVKVEANLEEDPYDDIVEETTIEKEIEEEVKEDYLEEETI